jgi:chitinase
VKHNFDGLDVDIEGPSINKDYGAFIADLSKAFKPKGKLLTAALSKGYGGDNVPSSVFSDFDFVSVMAYDGTGPWAPNRPGQHSSMEFARDNVDYWIKRGLPKSKTVLGVPFYGYGFGEAAMGDEWSYKKILAAYPGAEKVDQIGNTIYYNGIPTIKAKAKYVLDEGLAGVMIWSLNSDQKGPNSLLDALHTVLQP